jgi:hypothetical protein
MIIIDDTLISDHLFEVKFCCDLAACKGTCCVHGDAGAPLEDHEFYIIEDNIEEIKPYMTMAGKAVIEKNGVYDYDSGGELVTPLIDNKECVFVYFEKGVALCAIEKAWLDKKIDFQKPISCHLYPIRIKYLADKTALNYHQWTVCNPARLKGSDIGLPLYKFLKEPLIRMFGEEWYEKLEKKAKKLKGH